MKEHTITPITVLLEGANATTIYMRNTLKGGTKTMTINECNGLSVFEKAMLEEMAKIRRAIEALRED
jgi:hypothetical protein